MSDRTVRQAVVNPILFGHQYCIFLKIKNTVKCPFLPVILKFQEILTQEIEGKANVNLDDYVSDLQYIRSQFLLYVFLKNY